MTNWSKQLVASRREESYEIPNAVIKQYWSRKLECSLYMLKQILLSCYPFLLLLIRKGPNIYPSPLPLVGTSPRVYLSPLSLAGATHMFILYISNLFTKARMFILPSHWLEQARLLISRSPIDWHQPHDCPSSLPLASTSPHTYPPVVPLVGTSQHV